MITAETILQEASTLPLVEQYRLGLRLLESAQSLFTTPQNGNAVEAAAVTPRVMGLFEGQGWVSEDFDAPLPDEFWGGRV
ncbi:MAG: DUF2281 domain-containing protein [Acidobacteria bacterium]|nr:DUF2281 domain-containing protein [Acidobacteriota bacterium]